MNTMRLASLQDALSRLSAVMREVEHTITVLKAEHDPLALHIFAARRHYRLATDTRAVSAEKSQRVSAITERAIWAFAAASTNGSD